MMILQVACEFKIIFTSPTNLKSLLQIVDCRVQATTLRTPILAQNQVFQNAEALKDIKGAIEQLRNILDEEEQPRFVHWGTGAINANTGGGTMKNYNNSGSGGMYNAQTMSFGRDRGTDSN